MLCLDQTISPFYLHNNFGRQNVFSLISSGTGNMGDVSKVIADNYRASPAYLSSDWWLQYIKHSFRWLRFSGVFQQASGSMRVRSDRVRISVALSQNLPGSPSLDSFPCSYLRGKEYFLAVNHPCPFMKQGRQFLLRLKCFLFSPSCILRMRLPQ